MNLRHFFLLTLLCVSLFGHSQTTILLEPIPVVLSNNEIDAVPLKFRISSDKEIQNIQSSSYDYCDGQVVEFTIIDNGEGFDETANDGIFTSNRKICYSKATELDYEFITSTITNTLKFSDNSEESYKTKIGTYSFNSQSLVIDTTTEYSNVGDSIFYTENLVNYVSERNFNSFDIDFPKQRIIDDFKNVWSDFENDYLVITSLFDSNKSTNNLTAFYTNKTITIRSNFTHGLFNHEVNHIWINTGSSYGMTQNSGHWGFIERESTGFSSFQQCGDGVFLSIFEENEVIKYRGNESNNGNYNDLELYLMGLIEIENVTFPIKYVQNPESCRRTTDFYNGEFEGGKIKQLSKEEFIDFVNEGNRENIKDTFNLKFIICSDEKLSREEHFFFDHIVKSYIPYFKSSTSNLGNVNPSLYKINTTIDLDADGFDSENDCDDNNPNINSQAQEITYNGIDDDCNAETLDDDLDQDGFVLADDCDDNNPNINSQAEEIPNNDIDEDCNGEDLVTTSIHEIEGNKINIFPNPVKNSLNIDITNTNNSLFEIRIYNLNGQTIISDKQVRNSITIDLSEQPSSVYLLEITDTKTGKKVVEKIEKVN